MRRSQTKGPTKSRPQWTVRLAFFLGLIAFGASLAVPSTSLAATVTLAPVKGAPATLDLDQMPMPPDVQGRSYTLRSDGGDSRVTVSGYSLAALVEAAGLDPVLIGYFEIARPGGGAVLLSRRQGTVDGAFPEGPPVIFRDDQGLHFLRPSSGSGDLNAADLVSLPADGVLGIQAREGTIIQVSAKSSVRKARVGQKVSFSAILDRAAAGEAVAISWYFDDGSSATGAKVSHSFRQPGLYDIVVGVTTAGDRVGASATVTVQVGEPKKKGPKRRGGGDNENEKAPDSGASEGSSGPGANGPGYSGPSDPGPSYSPSPSPASPSPVAQPQPRQPERQPAREPQTEPSGDQISGQLLSNEEIETQPLAAVSSEEEKAAQPPAARTGSLDPTGGGGIPGAAMGIGAALLLLGFGGVLEARGVGRLRW